MLLLAIDTSGKHGSIALAQGAPDGSCNILEVVPLQGGTFSAQLIPQVASLLVRHGFAKQNIDGFAAVSGPGSFTGLRVGLAAIKALAEVLRKPIAAVSLLEAVAIAAHTPGTLVAALDAGRDEIYAAEYTGGESPNLHGERLLARQEFVSWAKQNKENTVVTPDASIATLARSAGLQTQEVGHPRSDAAARLGWKKILSGDTVSPEALEANYIRHSDAEIFSKPGR